MAKSAARCAARSTCRSAKARPCAWWVTTTNCRDSSILSIPAATRSEDVNGGSRTGGRIAFRFEPNENFVITPRIVYQKLETDGYPRIDVYNILGNPYTTTEPAVDPGERGQVTQFREGIDDEFMLADLKLEFGFGSVGTDLGHVVRRSPGRGAARCQPAHRQRHQGSRRYGRRRASRIRRCTTPPTCRPSARKSGSASTEEGPFQWVAGAFYQQYDREYGQNLPTPGYDALTQALIGADSSDFNAPPDTPFFSRSQLRLQAVRACSARRPTASIRSGH